MIDPVIYGPDGSLRDPVIAGLENRPLGASERGSHSLDTE